jgi:hypothetical protein
MLWAKHLDKAKINLLNQNLQYSSPGNYTYGTKKLFCKEVNGKLLVRLSGEFKTVDTFLKEHGEQWIKAEAKALKKL